MKRNPTIKNSILNGVAGEYFVAAELSRMGFIASITLRNTKSVDILCSNSEAKKTVGIQVKSNNGSKKWWLLNEKCEEYYAENLFYIFVNLHDGKKHPDYFIVPSKIVADQVRKGHKKWLKTPGKHGQAHKDTSMRAFGDKNGKYLNKWNLLGLK